MKFYILFFNGKSSFPQNKNFALGVARLCKVEPDSKYFWHREPHSLSELCNSCHFNIKAAIDSTQTNGCVCVPIKLY